MMQASVSVEPLVIPLVGAASAAEYARTYGYDAIGRGFLVVSGPPVRWVGGRRRFQDPGRLRMPSRSRDLWTVLRAWRCGSWGMFESPVVYPGHQ